MIVGELRAVTVDEANGFIYWSDIKYTVDKVKQARLDGSNQSIIYGKSSCVTYQMV